MTWPEPSWSPEMDRPWWTVALEQRRREIRARRRWALILAGVFLTGIVGLALTEPVPFVG